MTYSRCPACSQTFLFENAEACEGCGAYLHLECRNQCERCNYDYCPECCPAGICQGCHHDQQHREYSGGYLREV